MSCTVKVACIQVPANDWKDAPTAWLFLKELIHAAAKEHDLVIVPESAYPAYFLSRHEAANVAPVSLILDQVSDIARASGSYIAFGYADGFANAATLFARDGKKIARKEKSYLWHFDHRWFTPGEEVMIADTEFGRVALVVCADARLTELVRVVALEGAKLIIDLANLTASGPYAGGLTNAQCEFLLGTRARENGVWLAVADKWGVEADTVTYAGRSAVYAPDGSCVAQAPSDQTMTVSADIALDSAGHINTDTGAPLPRRRPELYSLLTADTQDIPIYRILSEAVTPEFTTPYITVSSLNQAPYAREDQLRHLQRLVEHEPHLIVLPTYSGTIVDLADYQQQLETEQLLLMSDMYEGIIRSRLVSKEQVIGTYVTMHSASKEDSGLSADGVFPHVMNCSFGLVGVIHGSEALIPEATRCLMLAGADLVVWQHGMPYRDALPLARTRAAENRMYVAAVFSSDLSERNEEGASFIVDPNGNVIASTLLGRPIHATGVYCPLAAARSKSIVPGTHVVFDRKPKNYRRLTTI
ncbi:MAG: nitrilase-related carbon-nitrogen hydrolase [Bacilli bacterium]